MKGARQANAKSKRASAETETAEVKTQRVGKTANAVIATKTDSTGPESNKPATKVDPTGVTGVDSAGLGEPQDLLDVIDPSTDSVNGVWTLANKVLESSDAAGGRLNVPVTLPDEYDLRLVAERSNREAAIALRLKAGERQFVAYIDATAPNRDRFYGLGMVGTLERHRNATSKRKIMVLSDGQPNTIDVAIRRDRVVITVNGHNIIDWPGPIDQLGLSRGERTHVGDLQLLVLRGGLSVTEFTLRSPKSSTPINPTKSSEQVPDNAIDLLAGISPARDTLLGTWSFEDGQLSCASSYSERIVIARDIPDQYDLFLELTPISGRAMPGFQLPFRDKCISFNFNHSSSQMAPVSHPFRRIALGRPGRIFGNGTTARVKISVTDSAIIVHIDGVERLRWDAAELAGLDRTLDIFRAPIVRAITLESYESVFRVSKLHLAPIDSAITDRAGWRNPPPAASEIATAEKQLLAAYRTKITAARDNTAKDRLTDELRSAAKAEPSPIQQFVLLQIARGLARQMTADADGFAALHRVLEDVEASFQVDRFQWLAEDARFLVDQKLPPNAFTRLAHFATDTSRAAMKADEYEVAIEFLEIAQSSWRKAGVLVASRMLQPRIDRLKSLHDSFRELLPALEPLKSNPTDPDALKARAEFYCFTKDDWANGLVDLRRAGEELSAIAAHEIEAGIDGTRLALAVHEWTALASSDSPRDMAIRKHAAELAHRIIPLLEGADLAAMQKLVTPDYLISQGILAEDIHSGSAGKRIQRNVYGLKSATPVNLAGTEIRALVHTFGKHNSRGVVEVSADGTNWVRLGTWTQRDLFHARRENNSWLKFPMLADSRTRRLSEVQVRFRYSGGGDALKVRHVIWATTFRQALE